jgi:hypothetical protein
MRFRVVLNGGLEIIVNESVARKLQHKGRIMYVKEIINNRREHEREGTIILRKTS